MPESENLFTQSIDNLKISSLYEELFRHFKIPRAVLYEKIKQEGFNPYSTLKIRRVPRKKDFEILCGVGRMEAISRIAGETRYPNKPIREVRCQRVEQDDDENCIALILSESIDTKRFFKRFSPLQFFLLVKLLRKFSNAYLPKDLVKYEFDIKESLYQQLNTSYDFIIKNIRFKYSEFFEKLESEFTDDPLSEKLQDLKLINHAVELNELTDLTAFFHNKIRISGFYHKYCRGKSSEKVRTKNPAADTPTDLDEPSINDDNLEGNNPEKEFSLIETTLPTDTLQLEKPGKRKQKNNKFPESQSSLFSDQS